MNPTNFWGIGPGFLNLHYEACRLGLGHRKPVNVGLEFGVVLTVNPPCTLNPNRTRSILCSSLALSAAVAATCMVALYRELH